jgi:ABC-type dipeptide/oligopeptide/nickel transport system permease component
MFREQFCLNRPISEQYRLYIGNVFRGNWGYSFLYGLPVLAVIGEMLH